MVMLMICIIIGGMGVFRYQQVAGLAREAARYACVHGSEWDKATDQACPTQGRDPQPGRAAPTRGHGRQEPGPAGHVDRSGDGRSPRIGTRPGSSRAP